MIQRECSSAVAEHLAVVVEPDEGLAGRRGSKSVIDRTSDAAIGRAVKSRKPTIHGEMKAIPVRASRVPGDQGRSTGVDAGDGLPRRWAAGDCHSGTSSRGGVRAG